jgi:hypothetical protein
VEGDRLTKPSLQFIASGTVIGLYAVTMGALLCLAPERLVSVFRSVTRVKTAEWHEAVKSPSGRFLGALVFVFGGWLLWMLYFYRHRQ